MAALLSVKCCASGLDYSYASLGYQNWHSALKSDCNCAFLQGAYGFDNRIFMSFSQTLLSPDNSTNYAALGYHYPLADNLDLVGDARLAIQKNSTGQSKNGSILNLGLRRLFANNLEVDADIQRYSIGPGTMRYGAKLIYDFGGGISAGVSVFSESSSTELGGFVRYYFEQK
jgi:hypothetical protein